MGHSNSTQPSDDMPQGVTLRGGKYYFRKRIPKDIQEIPNSPYSQIKEYKKALGTSNRAEAIRLAANRLAILENEFAEIRSTQANNSAIANFATLNLSPQQARILSRSDCKSIYLGEFQRLEVEATREREEYEYLDEQQRERAIENIIETLAGATREREEGLASSSIERALEDALRRYGSQRSQVSPKDWHSLALKIQDARLEVMNRSLAFLGNKEAKPLSQSFSPSSIERHERAKQGQSGRSIANLCSSYLEDKQKSGVKPATFKKCEADTRLLCAFAGENMMIEEMGFDKGKDLIQFLSKIPLRRSSKTSIKEAVKRSTKDTEIISAITQGNYYISISSIFGYAVDHEWLSKNPLNNKILYKQLPKKNDSIKATQTGDDMNKIFGSSKFLNTRFKADSSGNRKEGRYWSVLLAVFHGMRINEAAQLLVEDVKEHKGITYLDIREENDKGEIVKSLKTKVSKRVIPLHKTILRLGFKEFVRHQNEQKNDRLFPELVPNNIENCGASVSKWFGRLKKEYLDCTNLKSGDKGLHSFRHKVTDLLRSKKVEDEMRYRLCGWDRDMKVNCGYKYGGGLDYLGELKEKVDLIEFEGFDESLLSKAYTQKPLRVRNSAKKSTPVRKRKKS
ncbi:MAG: integrase [Rubritalea sp.]|jgi:integrase